MPIKDDSRRRRRGRRPSISKEVKVPILKDSVTDLLPDEYWVVHSISDEDDGISNDDEVPLDDYYTPPLPNYP